MNRFYKLIGMMVYVLGLPYLVRSFISKRKVTFILYHDPDAQTFRKHVSYLTRSFNIIPLQQYLDYREGKIQHLPDYSMVITFDDGHRRNAELLQTIRDFSICPTFYICSSIVGTGRKYWFMVDDIDVKKMKSWDHEQRIKFLEQKGFSVDHEFTTEPVALTKAELMAMAAWCDIQSHTCFHPILSTCTDTVAWWEIVHSREEINKVIQKPVYHFAYPNGDYTEREIQLLKDAGYRSARTTDVGWNDRKSDPFRLKITGVTDQAPLWLLKAELTGIPAYIYNLYRARFASKAWRGLHVPERD